MSVNTQPTDPTVSSAAPRAGTGRGMHRTARRPTLAVAFSAVALASLVACGSSKAASTAAAPAASAAAAPAASSAFCTAAKSFGSLTKLSTEAMGMKPAEAMKDFEALTAKLVALKAAGAPADLGAAIDTLAARTTLEAKAEEMMVADPNGATAETKMLEDHKAGDDAAAAKLVAGVKTSCGVDLA